MPRLVDVCAVFLLAGVLGVAPRPAHSTQAEEGLRLAAQWCTSCHVVAPDRPGSDAGPPFEVVANRPEFSEGGLRAWLADPHPPMPNLDLTRAEIEQVIAYLLSLRRQ